MMLVPTRLLRIAERVIFVSEPSVHVIAKFAPLPPIRAVTVPFFSPSDLNVFFTFAPMSASTACMSQLRAWGTETALGRASRSKMEKIPLSRVSERLLELHQRRQHDKRGNPRSSIRQKKTRSTPHATVPDPANLVRWSAEQQQLPAYRRAAAVMAHPRAFPALRCGEDGGCVGLPAALYRRV